MPKGEKGWQKGRAKTGGRKPGVQNKLTRDVRELTMQTLRRIGGGDYLEWLAFEHPDLFIGLVKACLPKEIKMNVTNTVELVRQIEARQEMVVIEGEKKAS